MSLLGALCCDLMLASKSAIAPVGLNACPYVNLFFNDYPCCNVAMCCDFMLVSKSVTILVGR